MKPLVSVLCPTYNHGRFVRKTLDGFLSQKTAFGIEIVVVDDASTDNTVEILREYERRWPGIVRPFFRDVNLYQSDFDAWLDTFQKIEREELRGRYVALCEGDDLWIDALKLQMQVDHMERHPDCSLTVHNTLRICKSTVSVDDIEIEPICGFDEDGELTPRDIICMEHEMPHTSACVFRTGVLRRFPRAFFVEGAGDIQRVMHALTQGSIYFFNRVMSVYRRGVSGSYTDIWRKDIELGLSNCFQMLRFYDDFDAFSCHIYREYTHIQRSSYLHYIEGIEQKVDREAFDEMLERIGAKHGLHRYIRAYRDLDAPARREAGILDYARRYRYIYIYGAGVSAKKTAALLANHGFDVEGFVVTSMDGNDEVVMGRPVVEVSAFSPRDGAGVIVCVPSSAWLAIRDALDAVGVTDRFCPYLYELPSDRSSGIQ